MDGERIQEKLNKMKTEVEQLMDLNPIKTKIAVTMVKNESSAKMNPTNGLGEMVTGLQSAIASKQPKVTKSKQVSDSGDNGLDNNDNDNDGDGDNGDENGNIDNDDIDNNGNEQNIDAQEDGEEDGDDLVNNSRSNRSSNSNGNQEVVLNGEDTTDGNGNENENENGIDNIDIDIDECEEAAAEEDAQHENYDIDEADVMNEVENSVENGEENTAQVFEDENNGNENESETVEDTTTDATAIEDDEVEEVAVLPIKKKDTSKQNNVQVEKTTSKRKIEDVEISSSNNNHNSSKSVNSDKKKPKINGHVANENSGKSVVTVKSKPLIHGNTNTNTNTNGNSNSSNNNNNKTKTQNTTANKNVKPKPKVNLDEDVFEIFIEYFKSVAIGYLNPEMDKYYNTVVNGSKEQIDAIPKEVRNVVMGAVNNFNKLACYREIANTALGAFISSNIKDNNTQNPFNKFKIMMGNINDRIIEIETIPQSNASTTSCFFTNKSINKGGAYLISYTLLLKNGKKEKNQIIVSDYWKKLFLGVLLMNNISSFIKERVRIYFANKKISKDNIIREVNIFSSGSDKKIPRALFQMWRSAFSIYKLCTKDTQEGTRFMESVPKALFIHAGES